MQDRARNFSIVVSILGISIVLLAGAPDFVLGIINLCIALYLIRVDTKKAFGQATAK